MRWLLALALLILAACDPKPPVSPYDPFPKAERVQLVIEAAEPDAEGHAVMSAPIPLSADERRAVEATLTSESRWDGTKCFWPHHFFQYLDGRGRVIGEVQVCFCCRGAVTTKGRPGDAHNRIGVDLKRLAPVIQALGKPIDIGCHDGWQLPQT